MDEVICNQQLFRKRLSFEQGWSGTVTIPSKMPTKQHPAKICSGLCSRKSDTEKITCYVLTIHIAVSQITN